MTWTMYCSSDAFTLSKGEPLVTNFEDLSFNSLEPKYEVVVNVEGKTVPVSRARLCDGLGYLPLQVLCFLSTFVVFPTLLLLFTHSPYTFGASLGLFGCGLFTLLYCLKSTLWYLLFSSYPPAPITPPLSKFPFSQPLSTTPTFSSKNIISNDHSPQNSDSNVDVIPPPDAQWEHDVAYHRGRVLILMNSFGGRQLARDFLRQIVEPELRLARVSFEIYETKKFQDALSIVRDRRHFNNINALFLLGGDGTYNEVVNGLLSRPNYLTEYLPPIAVIPSGTSNTSAAEFLFAPSSDHPRGGPCKQHSLWLHGNDSFKDIVQWTVRRALYGAGFPNIPPARELLVELCKATGCDAEGLKRYCQNIPSLSCHEVFSTDTIAQIDIDSHNNANNECVGSSSSTSTNMHHRGSGLKIQSNVVTSNQCISSVSHCEVHCPELLAFGPNSIMHSPLQSVKLFQQANPNVDDSFGLPSTLLGVHTPVTTLIVSSGQARIAGVNAVYLGMLSDVNLAADDLRCIGPSRYDVAAVLSLLQSDMKVSTPMEVEAYVQKPKSVSSPCTAPPSTSNSGHVNNVNANRIEKDAVEFEKVLLGPQTFITFDLAQHWIDEMRVATGAQLNSFPVMCCNPLSSITRDQSISFFASITDSSKHTQLEAAVFKGDNRNVICERKLFKQVPVQRAVVKFSSGGIFSCDGELYKHDGTLTMDVVFGPIRLCVGINDINDASVNPDSSYSYNTKFNNASQNLITN